MFEHKKGYSGQSMVRVLSSDEVSGVLASPDITERLEKSAKTAQALARKSDDFLYFTIIFLKAAEAALIDEHGNTKKVGSERAWGYFDNDWRWHGNVKCHKNNNGDIFPESELKIATRKWIGTPLCVDHKSDSVDGIRGIILDTYYDEKLKQVVGLCALDKVNYPDLARKVSTGVVRFGSMGTGVETSVCSEFDCANQAKSAKEYCQHVMTRSGWGEVNIGLKPIEYSLVVQPAEPGARLLRCIASIKEHSSELKNYGVDDIDKLTSDLNLVQADSLDRILNTVCGGNGCSITQRRSIVTAFLDNNQLKKTASLSTEQQAETEFAEALAELKSATGKTPEDAPELYEPIFRAFGREFGREIPSDDHITFPGATSGDPEAPVTIQSPKDSEDTPDYTGTGGNASLMSGETEPSDSFGDTGGVGPESYAFASEDDKLTITTLKEDIMKESRLRKRAEMRRRLAYHFGGADGVEPTGTYKDEGAEQNKIREKDDKHMTPTPASLGGTDGMYPGDKETKEKQKRAELANRMQKRVAYHFGGAEGVEPSTFTSEDYHKYWDLDKHMSPNPGSLGGTDGMYPGDKETKEKQKRAAYNGPALRTRLTQRQNLDGSINRGASKFEVFAGDQLVIATTGNAIYGSKLADNWDFLVSPEYGKRIVAEIRESGIAHVGRLLTKSAQDLGLPGADMGAGAPPAEEAPMDAAPMDAAPMEMDMEEDLGEESSPKSVVEESFLAIEEAIAAGRDALGELSGGDIDVNVNVGGEGEEDAGQIALARSIVENLKVVLADADTSADELACISMTYDNYRKLTAKQKSDLNKMTRGALRDSSEIVGETKTLVRMAGEMSKVISKGAVVEHTEVVASAPPAAPAKKAAKKAVSSAEDDLIAEALQLRKMRREALIARAEQADSEECPKCEADDQECPEHDKSEAADQEGEEKAELENEAHDGIGQHPTKSNVQTNSAEEIATKAPSGTYSASSQGGPDVKGDQAYTGTKSRQLAEAAPSINHADDKVKEVAEEVAEEEVSEHEDKMHDKAENSTVTAKMKESFIAKKASEEREKYRIKLRRAYDVGMSMQSKGLLPATKTSLDRQVDEIMSFDDAAFESFKRSIANANAVDSIKTASDLTNVNVGISDEGMSVENADLTTQLKNLWA